MSQIILLTGNSNDFERRLLSGVYSHELGYTLVFCGLYWAVKSWQTGHYHSSPARSKLQILFMFTFVITTIMTKVTP